MTSVAKLSGSQTQAPAQAHPQAPAQAQIRPPAQAQLSRPANAASVPQLQAAPPRGARRIASEYLLNEEGGIQ